jgi:hypothetical protein
MGYRGDDLDLRTGPGWSSGPGLASDMVGSHGEPLGGARGWRQAAAGRSTGPIWVDETVLACCNHAFEVALAHRSEEVRIEHLLHALTRVEPATEILQARGIRVVPLRRDTATVIASELPISSAPAGTAPRRSNEMAEVLRLAAAEAAHRNAPAGVADVLDVLVEMKPEFGGASLLSRNMGRLAPEPRYVERPEPPMRERRERDRRGGQSYARFSSEGYAPSRTDNVERALDAFGANMAEDRSVLHAMLHDVRREIADQRQEQARLGSGLDERLALLEQLVSTQGAPRDEGKWSERLRALETGLDQRLNGLAQSWTALTERLQALEHAIREPRHAEQQAMLGLTDRLKTIESTLTQPGSQFDLRPLSGRLDIIEEALLSHDSEPARELVDRTRALEEAISAQRAQSFETASSLAAEIKALSGAVTTQASQAERIQSAQSDRLQVLAGLVDRHRSEMTTTLVEPLATRMQGVVRAIDVRQEQIGQALATLMQRVSGIETGLLARVGALEQSLAQHAEKSATGRSEVEQAFTELGEALVQIHSAQRQTASDVEKWHAEAAGDIAVVANRLEGMEREASRPFKMLDAMKEGIDRLQHFTVDRERRRSRFWVWLFGTEDWQAASWPRTVGAIEQLRGKPDKPV